MEADLATQPQAVVCKMEADVATQPQAVVCKMEAQLQDIRMHTRFCTFGADLYAQLAFTNKISASELSRKFTKGPWLVGYIFLTCSGNFLLIF